MDEHSRSSRKLAICLAVLLCVGAGAWLFLFDGGGRSLNAAKQLVFGNADISRQEEGSALKDASPVSSESAERQSHEEKEISASISTLPPSPPSDPHAELVDRVTKAMEKEEAVLPGGDNTSGRLENTPPAQDETKQDSVVTGAFVRDLALWLVSNYVPSRRENGNGRSTATLIQCNFRYSNSGALRSVERDPLKGRSSVLNYVFTPGMLEALYHMYALRLVDEMEQAARKRGRHTLSDAQAADMFMVYAGEFQRLSASLDAAAQVDLAALSSPIHSAEEREAMANDDFARAYTALSMAREEGNSGEVAIQSRRMAESSHVAGIYAARQERARSNMAYALRRKAGDNALPYAELVFLGEWLSRRHASAEAIRASALICGRMAKLCEEKALAVLAPHAAPNDSLHEQPSEASSEDPALSKPQANAAASSPSPTPEDTPQKAEPVQTKAAEPSPPASVQKPEAAHSSPSFVREVSGSLSFEPLPKSEPQKAEASMPESSESVLPSSENPAGVQEQSSSENAGVGANVLLKDSGETVPPSLPGEQAEEPQSSAPSGTPSAEQPVSGESTIQPAPEKAESVLPSSENPAGVQTSSANNAHPALP